jgi:hypothetical protein
MFFCTRTMWAYYTIRPSQIYEIIVSSVFIREIYDCLLECLRFVVHLVVSISNLIACSKNWVRVAFNSMRRFSACFSNSGSVRQSQPLTNVPYRLIRRGEGFRPPFISFLSIRHNPKRFVLTNSDLSHCVFWLVVGCHSVTESGVLRDEIIRFQFINHIKNALSIVAIAVDQFRCFHFNLLFVSLAELLTYSYFNTSYVQCQGLGETNFQPGLGGSYACQVYSYHSVSCHFASFPHGIGSSI